MSVVSDCQVTCPHNLEKRLTIDLMSIREAIEAYLIRVRWVNTHEQLADALTKFDKNLATSFGETLIQSEIQISLY